MLNEVKQKKSARYERYTLSQMKQNKTEATDEFCRRIIKQVEACKIPEWWRATAIVDALIAGSKHQEIRKKLMQSDPVTLGEALKEFKEEETKPTRQDSNGNARQRKP